MMINAYFTKGMFPMAKTFLKSLSLTNGEDNMVILSTRDLEDNQIKELHTYYPNLTVENKIIDMERFAARAKVSVNTLIKYRREVENSYVTPQNRVWKLMIAAEDRPRALFDLLQRDCFGKIMPIYHFDIDTLFLKNISPITETAMNHDCCLLLRYNIMPVKAKITISTMFWRRTEVTMEYFDRWMHYLDILPPPERPIGYGQTSCWYAFKDVEHKLKCHTLGPAWGYPGKKMNQESNYVWSGAVHKLKKNDCTKLFAEKLEELTK